MSNLFGSLSTALRSLLAQEGALDTTANNMADVNTPDYSRQLAILMEAPARATGQISTGNGVDFEAVQSVRDNILELRIDQETQQQNCLKSYVNSMNQVQSLFHETEGIGLSDAISRFFNSFQELCVSPTNVPFRQAVISAGKSLASGFQQTGQQLRTIQEGVDREVSQTVEEINSRTTQLASLNQQIGSLQSNGEQTGRLEDRRHSLLKSLSDLVDVAVTRANDGSFTLTTTSGLPLVAGARSFPLSAAADTSTGFQNIFSRGAEVTVTFTGGQLAGLLAARDQAIPSAISHIDNLASGIIHSVNTQSQKGYDLNGDQGSNFFQAVVQPAPGSKGGAAENMGMAINDPCKIAASSDGTPGDNANALAMANIRNQPVVNGETPAQFYLELVCTVGEEVSNATDEQEAAGLVLTQMQNQRSAVPGVSLDEEAANLIRYQRAYEAAAEVVAAINDITNDVSSFPPI